jgi:LPXTG-site transpeptidase (sortase) family protein
MPGEQSSSTSPATGRRTARRSATINELKPGDLITLELPYATVVYRVTRHRIVDDNDVSVLKSPHHEQLVLQACHPPVLRERALSRLRDARVR